MSYLIDTNVLSELRRPRANPRVVRWFADLVTRNVADFNLPSLKVVNPWNEVAAP